MVQAQLSSETPNCRGSCRVTHPTVERAVELYFAYIQYLRSLTYDRSLNSPPLSAFTSSLSCCGCCKGLLLTWRGAGDAAIGDQTFLDGKSGREPNVPPNGRRATSRRGQMGTYYMNLSPGTNPGGLIRLRMKIGMILPASHICKAINNICGTQLSRSDSYSSSWASGVALLMVRM